MQMEPILTNDMLTLLRRIGDPLFDSDAATEVGDETRQEFMMDARGEHGLAPFLEKERLDPYAVAYGLKDVLHHAGTLPDQGLVKTACDLFARYGSEIAAALLLAALPEAYAAGEGAKVLAQRSRLIEGGALGTERILATAQFVIWVLTPGTPAPPVSFDKKTERYTYTYTSFEATKRLWGAPTGQALCASRGLRVMHSLIRTTASPVGIKIPGLVDREVEPLNQEDLLATLLSFTITVFEVLEQFGISWTAEEQEAYFYVWDHVGATLGIGDDDVICTLTGCRSLQALREKLCVYDETVLPPGDSRDKRARPSSERVTTRRCRTKRAAVASAVAPRPRTWNCCSRTRSTDGSCGAWLKSAPCGPSPSRRRGPCLRDLGSGCGRSRTIVLRYQSPSRTRTSKRFSMT